MGISDVETTHTPDANAETNLALEIGIKKEPGAVIDRNKVTVLVWVYDTVNDKDVEVTNADVSNEWLTKHDWSDSNPEMLLVRCVRSKTGGALSESSLSEAAAKVPGQKGRGSKDSVDIGQRKYLGYIIRVYYGDDLGCSGGTGAAFAAVSCFERTSRCGFSFEVRTIAAGVSPARFCRGAKTGGRSGQSGLNQPATLNLRGEILMQQGKFDNAEAAFNKQSWIPNFAMRNTISRRFHSKRKSMQKRGTVSRRRTNAYPAAIRIQRPS